MSAVDVSIVHSRLTNSSENVIREQPNQVMVKAHFPRRQFQEMFSIPFATFPTLLYQNGEDREFKEFLEMFFLAF
jgi:hypothetical protein